MKTMANQHGSVIVIVLVVLVAVTALGVTLIDLSSLEQEMVANDKWQEVSFYDADSCGCTTAKFLNFLNYGSNQGKEGVSSAVAPGVRYPASVDALGFFNKIMWDPDASFYTDDSGQKKFLFQEDLGFDETMLPAVADIRPMGAEAMKGSAANQFAAGYSAGIGLGGAGGGSTAKFYVIACEGRGMNNAQPQARGRTFARYRWVAGIPGGL